MTEAQFPEKLQKLFEPKRFKVLYGGRAAGRSWNVARALLLMGAARPIRVLCAREFQNSIAESSLKVLGDQVELLGLSSLYEIQKQGIFGTNGTSFAFEGIKNNVSRIKSYEGIDYCWVEEAAKVSKTSWDVLIPTIRKEGSEIWMTFNPELETDYTYKNFVRNANSVVDDTFVFHMTYRDNPWMPEALLPEIEKAKVEDYDKYLNVWEGKCLRSLAGAIYAKELRAIDEEGRVCSVPWDREAPVDAWLDLGAGKSDKTAIWFGQKVAMQNRILGYYENNLSDILHYAKMMQAKPYTYGTIWLPHDARASRIGTKMTIEEQFRTHFPNTSVRIVPKVSLTDGINAARLTLHNCWFDEEECEDGLAALRHYKYSVKEGKGRDGQDDLSALPLHDWASHGADAFRYLALTIRGSRQDRSGVIDRLRAAGEAAREAFKNPEHGRGNSGLGWMG